MTNLPSWGDIGLGGALALLGAVVVAVLLLHGWWSTRRARPQQPTPGAGTSAEARPGRVEPALGGSPGDTVPEPPRAGSARRTPRLDALIDALVPLTVEAPVAGEIVLGHLPPSRRAGSKPFFVEGLDTGSGEWEPPLPGRRYGELQAGVQMASRSGALNEIEYSEFVQKVQAFAEGIGASTDFPDMLDVAARARELDALTGPLDAQIAVTLRSNAVAWSAGYIQQSVARHGLVPGPVPGRWILPGQEDGAPPLVVLAIDTQAALAEDPQASPVRSFTLSLDVPQSPAAAEPFPAWHRIATALAEEMDASIVDDAGAPVTLHAFDAIGRELQTLYARLEALDVAAGSPAARRLFS